MWLAVARFGWQRGDMPPTPESRPSTTALCAFCHRPAPRHDERPEARSYDIDCETCGKYRVSKRREAAVYALAHATAAPWLRLIAQANAAGERLSIPGGMRIPLERPGSSEP